jgi:hypothetical protein
MIASIARRGSSDRLGIVVVVNSVWCLRYRDLTRLRQGQGCRRAHQSEALMAIKALVALLDLGVARHRLPGRHESM